MKIFDYFLVGLIVLATLGAILLLTSSDTQRHKNTACTMDALMCSDGTSVGRIPPDCAFAPCPEPTMAAKEGLLRVTSPTVGSTISSPVTITGEARGYWFFEGSLPISIVNWDGLIIGEGIATAQGEWMTEEFVPFIATVNFTFDPATPYTRGAIILKKDNPSGLREHDSALEVPITFN